MNDRELIEAAAKATGMEIVQFDVMGNAVLDWYNNVRWNPLTDDGDALRLAVKLKLEIFTGQGPNGDITTVCAPQEFDLESCGERHGNDAIAATRRAIVRMAAEIGKEMG
jgi:hypothetical protein